MMAVGKVNYACIFLLKNNANDTCNIFLYKTWERVGGVGVGNQESEVEIKKILKKSLKNDSLKNELFSKNMKNIQKILFL